MSTFKDLVAHYGGTPGNKMTLATQYPGMPLEQQVLLHKMDKYVVRADYRKIAQYVALFLGEYSVDKLPERAKNMLKNTVTKEGKKVFSRERDKDGTITGVGYWCKDRKSYRIFTVPKKQPS